MLVKHSAGGAGVGDPVGRDPEAVRDDVKNELVTLEAARDVYKVVLDPTTFEIDEDKTSELRA